jgi:hypothetical protein
VRSTKCDNVNTRKALESQHSPMISGEVAPLFLPYSVVIPRKGLGRFLRFVLSNFHVVIWLSKLLKNLKPIIHHFFKGCRQPEFVFGQEMCHILADESGHNLPCPINVDSSFFMKDLCVFFSGVRCIQCRIRSHLLIELPYLLMTPLSSASRTLQGATLIPPSFLANQSLDTLHNYLQSLLNSQQHVPDFVGRNPYPSGQGPFNLEVPNSLIYKHALARHRMLTSDRRIPTAQMSM